MQSTGLTSSHVFSGHEMRFPKRRTQALLETIVMRLTHFGRFLPKMTGSADNGSSHDLENSFSSLPYISSTKTHCLPIPLFFFFFYKFIYFIYLFLAVLGLRCCVRALSSCGERGPLLIAVRRLLTAVASLIVEHGLQAHGLQ